jgi:precorrin isomerase
VEAFAGANTEGNGDPIMNPDHRDLAIAEFADTEAALLERLVNLEADVAAYRELSTAAFDALRTLTVEYQTLQASCHRLREQYRALCERTLLKAGVDESEAA